MCPVHVLTCLILIDTRGLTLIKPRCLTLIKSRCLTLIESRGGRMTRNQSRNRDCTLVKITSRVWGNVLSSRTTHDSRSIRLFTPLPTMKNVVATCSINYVWDHPEKSSKIEARGKNKVLYSDLNWRQNNFGSDSYEFPSFGFPLVTTKMKNN